MEFIRNLSRFVIITTTTSRVVIINPIVPMNKLAQEILVNQHVRNQDALKEVVLEQTAFTPWEH